MGSDPIHATTSQRWLGGPRSRTAESIRKWGLTPVRVVAGGALVWGAWLAVATPGVPRVAAAAAIGVFALTVWRAGVGLLAVAALAPAGVVFAAAPIRTAELLSWAFLAAWLLSVWRPLSRTGWPRAVTIPALLYLAVIVCSWLMLTIAGAPGVSPRWLLPFLLRSIPAEHIVLSSPEPETWTLLQSAGGVVLFLAALSLAYSDRRLAPALVRTLVISSAILAVATLVEIARQWAGVGYGAWYLLRYLQGERFSLHLRDVNAAGSLYVLAGLTGASLAAFAGSAARNPAYADRARRRLWTALLIVMLPAVWLAGSRAAPAAAIVIGVLAIPRRVRLSPWRPARVQVAAAATALIVVIATSVLVAARMPDKPGGVARAIRLRSEFSTTTARMFWSSPVFGVGVGRYFNRSNEFMPDELRRIYGNENAHNYFAQQFAELGVVGGLLFIWLVVPPVVRGWRQIRSEPEGDGTAIGLVAGITAYLLTCVTGHPLLVPEAAAPFWIALGAVAAVTAAERSAWKPQRALAAAIAAVLVIGVARSTLTYNRTTTPPAEYGFHQFENADNGTRFRWMTRHAVSYVPGGRGVATLYLRAPDENVQQPLVVTVAIGGRVLARQQLSPDQWTRLDVGVRDPQPASFHRVDLRANEEWFQDVRLGRRAARRPISAMVREIAWTPVEP